MKIQAAVISTLCLMAVLSGCAKYAAIKFPLPTEAEIWEEVYRNTGSIQDFQGEAELTIESGFRIIPVQAKIYFRNPDWLTVRTYGPMGLKLIEASLQSQRFQVYSPFTNEYITGSLDSVNLATTFKLPFPNLDLREAWTRLFNPTKPHNRPAEVRSAGKFYILSYEQEDIIHEIWVNSKKMLIDRENLLDSTGVMLGYMAFSKYKKRTGARFPRKIEIGDIPRGVKLTIETHKFKLNSNIPDSEMMLSVPPTADRINLRGAEWR